MNQDHLTDEQLQDYLDKRLSDKNASVVLHLRHCTKCRRQLALYQDLYGVLNEDPVPNLSADFAGKVIAQVSAGSRSRWDRLEPGFIAAIILITLAISIYFVNPLPLLIETGRSLWHLLPFSNSNLLTVLSGNGPLVLIAIVIFLLVEFFDKKLLKHRA